MPELLLQVRVRLRERLRLLELLHEPRVFGQDLADQPRDFLRKQVQAAPALVAARVEARVVVGQRVMQAASDQFLGWSTLQRRWYYVRQLRDMKGSVDVARLGRGVFMTYAQACGAILAKAHARSGDRKALEQFMTGRKDFDRAISEYAVAYADQSARDYVSFHAAIASGRLSKPQG